METLEEKICTSCNKILSLNEFHKDSDTKDGLHEKCKSCTSIQVKAYYQKNIFRLRARIKTYRLNHQEQRKLSHRKYRQKYPEKMLKKLQEWTKRNLDAWRVFFPSKINCECCGKEIFFASLDITKSVHFDHRHGGSEAIKNPGQWLRKKPLNEKNRTIWESCDFGFLCQLCNKSMPTKNRDLWLENVNKYVRGTNERELKPNQPL